MQTINSSEVLNMTTHTQFWLSRVCVESLEPACVRNPVSAGCIAVAWCLPAAAHEAGASGARRQLGCLYSSTQWLENSSASLLSACTRASLGHARARGEVFPYEDLQLRRTASFCWEQSDERYPPLWHYINSNILPWNSSYFGD